MGAGGVPFLGSEANPSLHRSYPFPLLHQAATDVRSWCLRVRDPSGAIRDLRREPSEAAFVGLFGLDEPGPYDVSVSAPTGDAAVRRLEYLGNAELVTAPDHALLRELSSATGGAVLPDPEEWARRRGEGIPHERRLSGILLLAALGLVLVEWTVRQWRWSRGPAADRERRSRLAPLTEAKRAARPAVWRSAPLRTHIPANNAPIQPSLARLHAAKARARQ